MIREWWAIPMVVGVGVAGIIIYHQLPDHIGAIFGVATMISFFIGRWSRK